MKGNEEVVQVLQDVLRLGVSWLARTDAVTLALLRSMLEEREPLRVDAVAGSTESRKALRDLDRQIAGLLSSLGFTPTDRTRMEKNLLTDAVYTEEDEQFVRWARVEAERLKAEKKRLSEEEKAKAAAAKPPEPKKG